jgi:hypothetical protein
MRTALQLAALLAALTVPPAWAQSTGHAGTWTGTMQGLNGGKIPIEVKLGESSGTWRMAMLGAAGRNNPCSGKELPVLVQPGADAVVLDIQGEKLIQGCLHTKATLSLANDELKGTLADGRPVALNRK